MTTSSSERLCAERQQRTEEIINFLGVLDVGYRLPSWQEIQAGTDLHADHLRHIGRCIVRLREQGYLRRDMDAVVVEVWLNGLADALEAG